MNKDTECVALVDMDGTLADYDLAMQRDLDAMRSPCEQRYAIGLHKKHPPHIWERINYPITKDHWVCETLSHYWPVDMACLLS